MTAILDVVCQYWKIERQDIVDDLMTGLPRFAEKTAPTVGGGVGERL
jgi:hypothetical protein